MWPALLYTLYLLVGPLGWLAMIVLNVFGRRRMNLLERERPRLPEPLPTVRIVIPAKDEAAGIRDCVQHVLSQDYPALDVAVIDDRSTDGTGSILDGLTHNEPRLHVAHVTDLPPGWLGKCHALHVGTRGLMCDWIFFVDSDVQLDPTATRRMVALAEGRAYDALSVLPRIDARSFWERTLLPPMAAAWASAFRIPLTNEKHQPHAFANGQIFLIRRSAYEQVGGHATVRDQIVEDVALARVMKSARLRVRLMLGPRLAQTRMHTNLRQMFNGWARIFAGSAARSVWPPLLTLLWLFTAVASLGWGAAMSAATGSHPAWTLASVAHALLMLVMLGWLYRSAGQSLACVLAWPIAWPMVLALLANAVRVCRTGRVQWRGSAVGVNAHVGASGEAPRQR